MTVCQVKKISTRPLKEQINLNSRLVIKENTACVVATCQNNFLLPWHAILNRMPNYYGM